MRPHETNVWTIVVAGGSGQRFGRPKQYELLDDRRVIDHSRAVAESVSAGVVVVVPAEDAEREAGVAGGDTRSGSVRAGLAAVPGDAAVICVHDAARPLATPDLYRRVIGAVVAGADAAVPGVPVADTIKEIDPVAVEGARGAGGRPGEDTSDDVGVLGDVVATPDRARLVAVQTPQAFAAATLRDAHAAGGDATDDAGLVEAAGGRVVVVMGEADNRKITTPADLEWSRDRLAARARSGADAPTGDAR